MHFTASRTAMQQKDECICKKLNGYVCHYCRRIQNRDEEERVRIRAQYPNLDAIAIEKEVIRRVG